jgi:hypothetical protein
MVRTWHAVDPAQAEIMILVERRFQVDPNDARECAGTIAEMIAEAAG